MLSIHKNYKESHPQKEHGHFHPNMPHVGMRKVKSILALLAAFLVWQPFRLLYPDLEVHPIFIYIYALLEIRDNSAKTVNFGKVRIKATILALALGLPALALRVKSTTSARESRKREKSEAFLAASHLP